jgi:hypothetical protein
VPAEVCPVLPWTRRHVARVAARARVDRGDVWDEAIAALLRAALFFRPGAGSFTTYAKLAVSRGLWRYIERAALTRRRHGALVSLADVLMHPALTSPSAEAEAIAIDTARRAELLRQHAALATARADHATAARLREAADTATQTGRRA